MNIAAVYRTVTQSIIAELEQGAAPWVKPWKGGGRIGIMPANAVTGHHYRGINVPILWHAADTHGFPAHAWLTFKQALDKGAHVRKGEKGTQIVFTKQLTVKKEDADDEELQISMLRAFTVFNVVQVEGTRRARCRAETIAATSGRGRCVCRGDERRHSPWRRSSMLCPLLGLRRAPPPRDVRDRRAIPSNKAA